MSIHASNDKANLHMFLDIHPCIDSCSSQLLLLYPLDSECRSAYVSGRSIILTRFNYQHRISRHFSPKRDRHAFDGIDALLFLLVLFRLGVSRDWGRRRRSRATSGEVAGLVNGSSSRRKGAALLRLSTCLI